MKEIEKQRKIDAITETLGEFFDTVQTDVITKTNVALVTGENRAQLRNLLGEEEKRINETVDMLAKRAEAVVDYDSKRIIDKAKQGTKMLIASAMRNYDRSIARIHRLERVMPLREAIFKQTQEGIANGISVTYRDGKRVGYKEYMEMNVRTTLQQNVGEKQLELGGQSKVVFYICNTYADCADDHADYQGKIYYDERYQTYALDDDTLSRIKSHIERDRLMSVQDARDGKPYLTTRPNCRHVFTPISIDQALGVSPKRLLSELRLERGSYKQSNYEDTQKQRYNERMIRKYKSRVDMNEELLSKDVSNSFLERQISSDKMRVRQWQAQQRKLVASNPVLERDYRKETREILLKDLGAKYNR